MKENFDATQFITFDILDDREHILKQIRERFENLGFEVLQGEEIRKVKKQYFSKYIKKVFIELKDEIFLGEIELWPPDKEVTVERVINFVEQLVWIYEQKEIRNLSLILTGIAEEGETSDEVLKVKPEEIMKGILGMSSYNFDILADNLILEIV